MYLYEKHLIVDCMKISIIGAGNMGGAIARGLAQGSLVAPSEITVTAATQRTLDAIKKCNGEINTTTDNLAAVKEADIVVLAVKPRLTDRIAAEIKPAIRGNQILVSVAAGVSFRHLESLFCAPGCSPALFRVIPNTAVAVGESMTSVASYRATPEQERLILSLFDELGKSMMIEERLMEAATALGSCGTAFALRYIRAAMEGGIEMGLSAVQAREMVAQTVKGAAELLLRNHTHPEEEIDKVTTPGGITIKGLNEMERAGFTSAVIRGLKVSK